MRYTSTVFAFVAMAGCADVTDQAKLSQMQQTYNNQDDNECRSQGITVGTDPYYQCRDELARAHLGEIEAAKTARAQAEAAQAQAQPNSQPQPIPQR